MEFTQNRGASLGSVKASKGNVFSGRAACAGIFPVSLALR